jgi:hypothetical protein
VADPAIQMRTSQFSEYECSVSVILYFSLGAATTPTVEAYSRFVQAHTESLAYLVYHYNSGYLTLANIAL